MVKYVKSLLFVSGICWEVCVDKKNFGFMFWDVNGHNLCCISWFCNICKIDI